MSFPNPQYIKSFINEKLNKKDGESISLINEKQSDTTYGLEEVKVNKVPSDGSLTPDSNDDEHGARPRGARRNVRRYRGTASSSVSPRRRLNHIEDRNGGHSDSNMKPSSNYGTTGNAEISKLNGHKHSSHGKKYGGGASKDKKYKLYSEGRYQGDNAGYQRDGDEDDHVEHGHSDEHYHDADHDHDHEHGFDHDHGDSDATVESEHCHEENDAKDQRTINKRNKALKKLIIATILSAIFMCGEVLGGYLASSLAIMTDASHLLTDVSSFLISIIALKMAAKPTSKKMTFGWHRAEVIGAILSVFTIWIVTGILVYLAIMRLIKNDYTLDGKTMLITAACAVGFNIIMGLVLHEAHSHSHGHAGHSHGHSHGGHSHGGHSHDHSGHSTPKSVGSSASLSGDEDEPSGNVNVRAAFIHVLGDLLQSLGVLVAAFIIYFKPEYKIADPICTFFFSILVLITTFTILRDTVVIIMEDKNGNAAAILKRATKKLKSLYDFHSMTIQIEQYSEDMDDCQKCK